jgi:hypothetical protein
VLRPASWTDLKVLCTVQRALYAKGRSSWGEKAGWLALAGPRAYRPGRVGSPGISTAIGLRSRKPLRSFMLCMFTRYRGDPREH